MQVRVDPAQDRRVRSARNVGQMGLERLDRGPVGYGGEGIRRLRAAMPAMIGHGAAQRVLWGGPCRPGRACLPTRAALILMGDWCAELQRNYALRTKCAVSSRSSECRLDEEKKCGPVVHGCVSANCRARPMGNLHAAPRQLLEGRSQCHQTAHHNDHQVRKAGLP